MTVKVVVGKKGCIIIPKSIRELVGIKEGDVLTLTIENGRIVLEPERKLASSPPFRNYEQPDGEPLMRLTRGDEVLYLVSVQVRQVFTP